MSGSALLVARDASATACTVPSDCYAVGEVCHLGLCTPCESNFDDGGLGDPLLGCQNPMAPLCDIPDGSAGGACVQCIHDSDCPMGDVCAPATQTCVPGDGGAADATAPDGGVVDGSLGDAAGSDAAGDAPASTDGAASDGSTVSDASAGDGASSDGSHPSDAAVTDAMLPDGAAPPGDGAIEAGGELDGAYVVGDGCACTTGAGAGGGTAGALLLLGIPVGIPVVIARRKRSR